MYITKKEQIETAPEFFKSLFADEEEYGELVDLPVIRYTEHGLTYLLNPIYFEGDAIQFSMFNLDGTIIDEEDFYISLDFNELDKIVWAIEQERKLVMEY
ncbi:MAG: hypothetical protein LBV67_01580 [Streptococcaceae bacterium]|jgi:hypothetical protein|nr:hypothetical protein [Streptococcaceae bacterium]